MRTADSDGSSRRSFSRSCTEIQKDETEERQETGGRKKAEIERKEKGRKESESET